MRRIDSSDYPELEYSIGVTPGTVMALHALRVGRANAWISGDTVHPRALVIQRVDLPGEPMAFGTDAGAIWAIMRTLDEWNCINVDQDIARDLRPIMKWYYPDVRPYEDIYYTLRGAPTPPPPPELETRLLSPADLPLIEAADFSLHGFGSAAALLEGGIAAGSLLYLDKTHLVALAYTAGFAGRYAHVNAVTDETLRERGLGSYAAWLVMQQVSAHKLLPVWSAGERSRPAQRVAEKLGMREVSRRVYLIPSVE